MELLFLIMLIIGIIGYKRVYYLQKQSFPHFTDFENARKQYLYTYSFLALAGGIPTITKWLFLWYIHFQAPANIRALRDKANTIDDILLLFIAISLSGVVFFHRKATKIDKNKIMHYRILSP